MKRFSLMAASALALVSLVVIATQAYTQQNIPQRPGVPVAPPKVALLDVTAVFKDHARFKMMMDDMKAEVDRAEKQVKEEYTAIQKQAENLQQNLRPGSPDFKTEEQNLARRKADLDIKVGMQRKEFLAKEAKIYNQVYSEVENAVNYYCRQQGIDMVLRFSGEPVDSEKPESVLSYINKPVVWYNQQSGVNITPVISAELNRNAPNVGNRNAAPGATNPYQRMQ